VNVKFTGLCGARRNTIPCKTPCRNSSSSPRAKRTFPIARSFEQPAAAPTELAARLSFILFAPARKQSQLFPKPFFQLMTNRSFRFHWKLATLALAKKQLARLLFLDKSFVYFLNLQFGFLVPRLSSFSGCLRKYLSFPNAAIALRGLLILFPRAGRVSG
jgi:hypothetical protein